MLKMEIGDPDSSCKFMVKGLVTPYRSVKETYV